VVAHGVLKEGARPLPAHGWQEIDLLMIEYAESR
jgi:hypothetical protein